MMNDDMNDLAPALLVAVIVAFGLVAFEFRSAYLSLPTHATEVKARKIKVEKATVEKPKAGETNPKLAMNDRLHGVR
ncbi:hypothetical protein [Bradyrhizobium sp. LHD-71]|uniref:hypothetical protein n=1 Tax=Bradyrhizobium sp. LHD-71 TaxID=3072141 RepID=UPI00280CC102|nr:hypothetical protein [Bradyrhizobium sp. LHD-71]MDQ8732105.1 hypothetical protein [Bradyrhizobium sp. LHD-71]